MLSEKLKIRMLTKVILLGLFILTIPLCYFSCSIPQNKNEGNVIKLEEHSYTEWKYPSPSSSSYSGIIVMVHGLNQNPETFSDMIHEFHKKKIIVLIVRLKGFLFPEDPLLKSVTAEDWLKGVKSGLEEASLKGKELKLNISYFGYSLGGLIGANLLFHYSREELPFSKMVLLAPAIQLRTLSFLIKALFFLGDERSIPSYAPKKYRYHESTSIAAYRALFDLYDKLKDRSSREWETKISEVPLAIFIDPKDELVSYQKIQMLFEDYSNRNPSPIFEISKGNGDDVKFRYHHLCVSKEALGENEFTNMISKMISFLEKKD